VQTSPVKTKTLTLTEAGVLCLLAVEGERSGYELSKLATKSVGHIWAPAKSHLYAVLPRLAADGLARRRDVAQTTRPDKQLYRITREGKRALEAWLAEVEPGNVDAFHLRLFYGGLVPSEALVAHVEAFRDLQRERLGVFDEIDATNTNRGHDWYHRLLLDYGYVHARASLRWADDVLSKLRSEG
jgi:DNA-binding PadR family transcriptional regulator